MNTKWNTPTITPNGPQGLREDGWTLSIKDDDDKPLLCVVGSPRKIAPLSVRTHKEVEEILREHYGEEGGTKIWNAFLKVCGWQPPQTMEELQ